MENKSAILNLLNRTDFFDRIKYGKDGENILKELSELDNRLEEELKNSGELIEVYKKYKDCYDMLSIEVEENAVVAAFKLGLKIGIEAGE